MLESWLFREGVARSGHKLPDKGSVKTVKVNIPQGVTEVVVSQSVIEGLMGRI